MNNYRRLGLTSFAELIAPSIRNDLSIAAASAALDPILQKNIESIPNLLIWARLSPDLNILAPPMQRLVDFAKGLKLLSDAELELLAWQEHVDFWQPEWSRNIRENLIRTSTEWHRLKGTPAGMKLAFALFGMQIGIEEHALGTHWASYQLDLGQVDDVKIVKLAWKISQEMQPVRCKLFRMYTDEYNISPLIYSQGNYSEHFYSFFSGVSVGAIGDDWENGQGDDLQLSFGSRLAFETEKLKHFKDAKFFGLARQGFEVPYLDYPMWSYFNYSDAFTEKYGFILSQFLCFDAAQKIYSSGTWEYGTWANHPWAISFVWDRPLPEWSMCNDSIFRSQLIYSDNYAADDSGNYSGLNACYSVPTTTREGMPFVWSDSKYSDDTKCEQIIIHEQKLELKSISIQPLELKQIITAHSAYQGFEIPYIDSFMWSNFAYSDPIFESIRLASQEYLSISCAKSIVNWSMVNTSISRSQFTYSDNYAADNAGNYSGLNSCYSMPITTREGMPFVWSDSCYSDDVLSEQIIIHEQTFALKGISTQERTHKPTSASIQRIGFATQPMHNTTWSKATWGDGSWYDYIAYYSITSISK